MATLAEPDRGLGRIVTFYSYKGGTGRSMALANVAWILASNGLRVLVLDWDLEAPGLHRYFHPFLVDKELTNTPGIIDFIVDFAAAAVSRTSSEDESSDWYWPYANLLRNAISLNWTFPGTGTLDFVPAGRQDGGYALRVNSFQWQHFYEKLGGGVFLEAVKTRIRKEYDYVLIDSRTGVSDTSGVCTVQMPDQLVVCFTLNHQSIEGASVAANSALIQRRRSDDSQGLVVWPVPMRVELFEKQKLELARDVARDRFDRFLWMLSPAQREYYWGYIEIPYQPFYAYEEILATFADRPGQTNSMLASMERLTYCLTTGTVFASGPMTDDERADGFARYSRQPGSSAKQEYQRQDFLYAVSYAESDWDESITRFHNDLLSELRARMGDVEGFVPAKLTDLGSSIFEIEWKLRDSQVLICLVTPNYLATTRAARDVRLFSNRAKPVIPIPWVATRGPAVAELQELLFYLESLPQRYGTQNVRDLLRFEKQSDNYRDFLVQLSSRLARFTRQRAVSHIDSRTGAITFCIVSAKQSEAVLLPGPIDLYGDSAEDWSPFTEGYRRPISDSLRTIGGDYRLSTNILSAEAFVGLAGKKDLPVDNPVVVISDIWTLTLSAYLDLLKQIEAIGLSNVTRIACVDLGGGRKEQRHRLRELLNDTDSAGYTYYVYDYESLEDAILSAFVALSAMSWEP